tara:strand:- start:307 stop:1803 length:1497 start_codon:yes stop_codon:yes gene_type:complete
MRLFIQFAPSFLNLPVAALNKLKSHDIEYVGGLYCGTHRFHDWLMNQPACKNTPMFYPDPIEMDWVRQPLDHAELDRIRKVYGDDELQKIIIGDRHIGVGYVTGGLVTPTTMTKAIQAGGPDAIWQYLVSLFCAIEKIFDETNPDAIFQHAVAGAVSLTTRAVAKSRGIRAIKMEHARIGSQMFLTDGHHIAGRILTLMEDDQSISEESRNEARAKIESIRKSRNVPEYTQMVKKRLQRRHSVRSLPRSLCKIGAGLLSGKHDTPHSSRFHNGVNDAMAPWRYWAQRNALKQNLTVFSPESSGPFAYYPLHVDPEASTMVLAPRYTDQLSLIRTISQSVPIGMKLVVKEHRPMIGRRPASFYSRIARIPGVILVSPDLDSHEMIQTSSIITTITGTTGLESVIIGKPTLVIGDPYYRHIDHGIIHLEDHSSMSEAIAAALVSKPAEDEDLIQFLGAVNQLSFTLPSRYIWTTSAQANDAEMNTAATTLAQELIEVCKS